jgi:flagellar motility protein MotE (MotC chaperone)
MAKANEGKKQKKSGFKYFILTIFMLIIFLGTLLGGIVFFDLVGVINISKVITKDSKLAQIPYIGTYIGYSYNVHLTEEERLRNVMLKYQEILENKRQELELKEAEITTRETDLKEGEKNLLNREKEIISREEKLTAEEERLKELAKGYQANSVNITKFSEIYSKMEPASAAVAMNAIDAEVIAQIFEQMEDKRIAKILNSLSQTSPAKVKEIVELMIVKEEVDEVID